MKASVGEIPQRIIHKAMALDAGFACESGGRDAHAEVAAKALGIGPGMPGVRGGFVQHLQHSGLQRGAKSGFELWGGGGHVGAGRQPGSAGPMWREMYSPWPMMNSTGKA